MEIAKFTKEIQYKEDKPTINLMLETAFTKEIRIAFRKGQALKQHKTNFPIVVQIVEGTINFGVEGKVHPLETGDLISLEPNILHDLFAVSNSIVRLTLLKGDHLERVQKIVQ